MESNSGTSSQSLSDFTINELMQKVATQKIVEVQPKSVQQLKPKMPSEGAFMEWAQSQGFNCSQAASTYNWFARHFGH